MVTVTFCSHFWCWLVYLTFQPSGDIVVGWSLERTDWLVQIPRESTDEQAIFTALSTKILDRNSNSTWVRIEKSFSVCVVQSIDFQVVEVLTTKRGMVWIRLKTIQKRNQIETIWLFKEAGYSRLFCSSFFDITGCLQVTTLGWKRFPQMPATAHQPRLFQWDDDQGVAKKCEIYGSWVWQHLCTKTFLLGERDLTTSERKRCFTTKIGSQISTKTNPHWVWLAHLPRSIPNGLNSTNCQKGHRKVDISRKSFQSGFEIPHFGLNGTIFFGGKFNSKIPQKIAPKSFQESRKNPKAFSSQPFLGVSFQSPWARAIPGRWARASFTSSRLRAGQLRKSLLEKSTDPFCKQKAVNFG